MDGQGADEEEYQRRLWEWNSIAERFTKNGIIWTEPNFERCPYCNAPDDTLCGHAHLSHEALNRLLSSDW